MPEKVKPYQTEEGGKKEQVTKMFDNIAGGYDFLNRVLSARFDVRWRNLLTEKILSHHPEYILDVATGTADVALTLTKRSKEVKVRGVDISNNMLAVGEKKVLKQGDQDRIELAWADAENMEEADESYDVTTCSFGVRNFENLEKGLQEMYRVTRQGGYIYILEFSRPRIFPLKQLYNFYFRRILPVIGRFRSKDPKAYQYLYESVQAFPDRQNFLSILQEVGYKNVAFKELTFGICQIYSGEK